MRLKSVYLMFLSLVLVSCDKSVRINDEFTIEYLEMYTSISLTNENQGFVGDVTEAYWNNDSLVVSGDGGCYLLNLKTIKYNDEMINIDCGNLNHRLKKGEIKSFIRE